MTMYKFATGDDLTTAGVEVEHPDEAILAASALLTREVLASAVFDTDDEGAPADEHVREAFKAAAIAQLRYWEDTGDMSGALSSGGGGSIGAITLPGTSRSTGTSKGGGSRVAPVAVDILTTTEGVSFSVGY